MTEPITIEVGGKRFRLADPAGLSVEQDGWVSAKLDRAIGADAAFRKLKASDRRAEARLRILESGQISVILAGFLVEEGKTWTREGAIATMRLLAQPMSGEVRALLFASLDGAIQGFFGDGSDGDVPIGKPSAPDGLDAQPPDSSAASIADSGTPSSAPSGDTTPSASPPDSVGSSMTPSPPTSTS